LTPFSSGTPWDFTGQSAQLLAIILSERVIQMPMLNPSWFFSGAKDHECPFGDARTIIS